MTESNVPVQSVDIDDALLQWLTERDYWEDDYMPEGFMEWAKEKEFSFSSITVAYALTRLIQEGKMKFVAPFGTFRLVKGN